MLEQTTFIVKEKAKLLSSRGSYEILDDTGKVTGTAEQSTTTMAKIVSMVPILGGDPSTKIDFREKPDDSLVFTVRRRGMLLKKVEVLDATGAVIGLYKAKKFSLSGGFHVYDGAGKHVAEIRGKLLKSEYTFFQPDGKTEMGKVSKKWAGSVKAVLTSADTYGVEIAPAFADQPTVKMLILGAAVAIDCLMGGGGAAVAGGDGGGSDE